MPKIRLKLNASVDSVWTNLCSLNMAVKTSLIMGFLLLLSLIFFMCIAIKSNVISLQTMLTLVILCDLLLCFLIVTLYARKMRILAQIACGIIAMCLLIGSFYINAIGHVFERIHARDTEKVTYSVITLKDNKTIKGLGWMGNVKTGFIDDKNAAAAKEELKDDIEYALRGNYTLNSIDYTNINDLVEDLLVYKDKMYAICIDQAYIDVLNEEIEDFDQKIKVIYEYDVEVPNEQIESSTKRNTEDPFIVYVSGVDDRITINGDNQVAIPAKSYDLANHMHGQSKTNMLIVVNPSTRKVLIVYIPSNYYVQLGDNASNMDKIENTGLYNIGSGINALEELYGINIDYYLKTSYEAFAPIIDAIGGVDVYLDDASQILVGDDVFYLERGSNHFNGEQALAYVNNDKDALDGQEPDIRWRNILNAVINKITSTNIIFENYNPIMMAVDEAFQTDMSTDEMAALFRLQIADSPQWSVGELDAIGIEDIKPLYSLGTDKITSEVIIPGEDSLSVIKDRIRMIMSGE